MFTFRVLKEMKSEFKNPYLENLDTDRILIIWELNQLSEYPEFTNITIQIINYKDFTFVPPQNPEIKLPRLDNNEIIVTWILKKPFSDSAIELFFQSDQLEVSSEIEICSDK